MIRFAKAEYPNKPKTIESVRAAYLLAGLLTIFALGQLFEFNQFLELFGTYNFFDGEAFSRIVAASIIICEVFALPFLLGMRLSKLFRVISMAFGWIAVIGWLIISIWTNLIENTATNFGLLGTKIQLVPGLWAISFCIALCILCTWASWGLWPLLHGDKKQK